MSICLKDLIATRKEKKYSDYAKHISWVFHKTQVLPRIVFIGKNSETIPLRNYKLRICEITRLDASDDAPDKKELFADHVQRSYFNDITTESIDSDPKLFKKYHNNMNVVIVDDYELVDDEAKLLSTILDSEKFLTNHGRILFDVPIRITAEDEFETADYPLDADEVIPVILAVIRAANKTLLETGVRLIPEEIKLTVAEDASRIVGIRVYLKKEISSPYEASNS